MFIRDTLKHSLTETQAEKYKWEPSQATGDPQPRTAVAAK